MSDISNEALIPAPQLAGELGITRRTLARWLGRSERSAFRSRRASTIACIFPAAPSKLGKPRAFARRERPPESWPKNE